ncbi:hypothetical protein K438DRAFT_2013387, partial [Mycena galopus ATCC 62051]
MSASPGNYTHHHPNLCELSLALPPSVLLASALSDSDLSGAFDPDVLGYAVRLSSFVMNVLAGVLIRWGNEKDSDDALRNILIQMGSIVVSTMISIGRHQFTLFDGIFTLTVVHSPISWYIMH